MGTVVLLVACLALTCRASRLPVTGGQFQSWLDGEHQDDHPAQTDTQSKQQKHGKGLSKSVFHFLKTLPLAHHSAAYASPGASHGAVISRWQLQDRQRNRNSFLRRCCSLQMDSPILDTTRRCLPFYALSLLAVCCSPANALAKTDAVVMRRPENGPMQFHPGTEDQLLQQVLARASTGDPWSVISAVDEFCWNQHWMMNVGPDKGAFVDEVLQKIQPKVVVELGTYVGYSTVRWAAQLQNGARLWSIDPEPSSQVFANELLAKAGLKDRVTLIRATAEDAVPYLQNLLGGQSIDLLFIDHEKSKYLPDLERIEKAGLLRKGSVVVADNVLVFQISDYLDHVRNSGLYSSTRTLTATLEYDKGPGARVDGVEVSMYSGVR